MTRLLLPRSVCASTPGRCRSACFLRSTAQSPAVSQAPSGNTWPSSRKAGMAGPSVRDGVIDCHGAESGQADSVRGLCVHVARHAGYGL